MMRQILRLLWLGWLLLLNTGCAVGIRAEGCDLLLVELEGIREADALPVKPP